MPSTNFFDPLDYGGLTDAAMQGARAAARAAGGAIVLSPGKNYQITTPVLLDWQGASIGSLIPGHRALITSNHATNDMIQIADYMADINIQGLYLKRSVTPTAGAGIRGLGGTDRCRLSNILAEGQFIGFSPGGCSWGWLDSLEAISCVSHGFYARSIRASLPIQWVWSGNSLFGSNGGCGLLYDITGGPGTAGAPASISTGRISGIATFNNAGNGMAFIGDAYNNLQAIRADNCFIGGDLQDEIYVDAYGGDHRFDTIFMELGGNRGMILTPNNPGGAVLNNITANGHNNFGIGIGCDDVILSNSRAIGNGRTNPTNKWGVYVYANRVQIDGLRTRGDGVQQYGIVYDTAAHAATSQVTNHNGVGNLVGSMNMAPGYAAANV